MMPRARRFIAASPASPLEGVTSETWARFVALVEIQPVGAVSESGGLGAYDLRPRRLVELGYANGLRRERTEKGRQVYACDFVMPWTEARFLADPVAQYAALTRSMKQYHSAIVAGELKVPEGVSLFGALMILHIGGRGALASYPNLFENTQARYETIRGAF